MWFVYILLCADGTYYYGCTSDIDKRLVRHEKGEVSYTSVRLPLQLVCYIAFTDRYKAYQFEKYLKSGSGRTFAKKRFIPEGLPDY